MAKKEKQKVGQRVSHESALTRVSRPEKATTEDTALAMFRTGERYRALTTLIIGLTVVAALYVIYHMLGLVHWGTSTSFTVSVIAKVGIVGSLTLATGGGAGAVYGVRTKKRADRLAGRNQVLEGKMRNLREELSHSESRARDLERDLERVRELRALDRG